MAQLWGGRFTKETDQLVYKFNASISFDQRFYEQDIKGSMAHVTMLAKQGILTDAEKETIITGMDADAAGCQRIVAGTQSMTSWGDTRQMGKTAVDVAIELLEKGTYPTSEKEESVDADGNKIEVPAVLLDVTFIDKDNIDILIDEGYHTKEDIYG